MIFFSKLVRGLISENDPWPHNTTSRNNAGLKQQYAISSTLPDLLYNLLFYQVQTGNWSGQLIHQPLCFHFLEMQFQFPRWSPFQKVQALSYCRRDPTLNSTYILRTSPGKPFQRFSCTTFLSVLFHGFCKRVNIAEISLKKSIPYRGKKTGEK